MLNIRKVENMESVLFLVSWIMVGLVGSILGIASDIRGCEYDEDYFDGEVICAIIVTTIAGYLGLIFTIIFILHNRHAFSKLIYKIANIGIKKEKNNEED